MLSLSCSTEKTDGIFKNWKITLLQYDTFQIKRNKITFFSTFFSSCQNDFCYGLHKNSNSFIRMYVKLCLHWDIIKLALKFFHIKAYISGFYESLLITKDNQMTDLEFYQLEKVKYFLQTINIGKNQVSSHALLFHELLIYYKLLISVWNAT